MTARYEVEFHRTRAQALERDLLRHRDAGSGEAVLAALRTLLDAETAAAEALEDERRAKSTVLVSRLGREVATITRGPDGWRATFPELGIDLVRDTEEAAWGALYLAIGQDRVVLLAPGDAEIELGDVRAALRGSPPERLPSRKG